MEYVQLEGNARWVGVSGSVPAALRTLIERVRLIAVGLFGSTRLNAGPGSDDAARARFIHQVKL